MVDYNYYKETFKGTIDSISFEKYEPKAEKYLNYYCSKKIINIDNQVKDTVCALVEGMYDEDVNPKVASESIGGWSKSFVTKTNNSLNDIISLYMNGRREITRWL